MHVPWEEPNTAEENYPKVCLEEYTVYYPLICEYEICEFNSISLMQESVNIAAEWTNNNDMKINSEKSKEMIISYAHGNIGNEVPNILIEGKVVERVDHVKLLGITLSNDLTWKRHVDNIVKKAGNRIYMLYQLKRAGVTDFVFRYSDGSHVSVDTIHPSLLPSTSHSSPRWYHLQNLSSDVVLVSPHYVAKPPESRFPAPLCDTLYLQSLPDVIVSHMDS